MTIEILRIADYLSTWKGKGYGLFVDAKLISAFAANTEIENSINNIFNKSLRSLDIELETVGITDKMKPIYNININKVMVGRCVKGSLVYKNIVSFKNS